MANMAPNDLLRSVRESRHLSRAQLAAQIGTARGNIGRWERGDASPNLYFMETLCDFFQLLPEELGFPPLTQQSMPLPSSVIYDPAIPLEPAIPLVGRDQELAQLKHYLSTQGSSVLTALNGLPGVGKTALAIALAHDQELRDHFRAGVLWAGLGPDPNIPGQLRRWGTLLGLSTNAMGKLHSSEAWAIALRTAIGARQMLLIIDDAWLVEESLAFKVGGPNCAHLVTTRFLATAIQMKADNVVAIQELNEEESIKLLHLLAPNVVESEEKKAHDLVQAVGGLPLALTLMGNYLRLQAYNRQPRRIQAALEQLSSAEARLKISEPRAPGERHPSLSPGTSLSLQSIIAVTDQQLNEQARAALYALSVFPAKPNSFSEHAALTIAACSEDTLDLLIDAGLLESTASDRYMLHQTIADYARLASRGGARPHPEVHPHPVGAQTGSEENGIALTETGGSRGGQGGGKPDPYLGGSGLTETGGARGEPQGGFSHRPIGPSSNFMEATERLITYANNYIEAHKTDYELLDQESAMIIAALEAAHTHRKQAELLRGVSSFVPFLLLRGNYIQAERQVQRAHEAAMAQGDQHSLTRALLYKGEISSRQGDYAQAETSFKEGLSIAHRIGDPEHIGFLLKELGWITWKQGNYVQADAYLQQGLELARQIEQHELISALLNVLGSVAASQGNYPLSEAYQQEGVSLAKQSGNREQICGLLLNLGVTAAEQGRDEQAEAYLQEGLTLARQIGHLEWTIILLLNMGEMSDDQGNYTRAESHYSEALALARQLGQRELISILLTNMGKLAQKQSNYSRAGAYLMESLDLAQQIGRPRIICVCLYEHGNLYLKQQLLDAAEAAFAEMLTSIPEGDQELSALAHYGLARVAAARGNMQDARELGEASVKGLEAIGHRTAQEVRHWLSTITIER